MPLSPEEIEGREFGLSRRGYDRDDVDEFLLEVADAVRAAEDRGSAPESGAGEEPPAPPLRSRLASGPADTDDFGRLGAEVAAVLRTADEGAARRRADAERVRAEAEAEATRLRDEADGYAHRLPTETEAERVRAEADIEARNARTALEEVADLPYVDEAEPLDAPTAGEPDDGTIPPVPAPPPPPADYQAGDIGVAPDDLPYASDSDDEDVIDLRESPEAASAAAAEVEDEAESGDDADEDEAGDEDGDAEEGEDGDPLAVMVRDAVGKAVKGVKRHRPDDG